MTHQIGVVAGALGIAGRALVEHLRTRHGLAGDRSVTSPLQSNGRASRDGRSPGRRRLRCQAARPVPCNTCLLLRIHAARERREGGAAERRNAAQPGYDDGADRPGLRHVQVVQGTKWYGHHLGLYRTPAREDDPRHPSPNFYYAQQDWLSDTQRGKAWTRSTLRPHCICGISVGSPMNHLFALSLHAAVSRALGMPLRFPGAAAAFRSIYQFTDARLLARAMVWPRSPTASEWSRPHRAHEARRHDAGQRGALGATAPRAPPPGSPSRRPRRLAFRGLGVLERIRSAVQHDEGATGRLVRGAGHNDDISGAHRRAGGVTIHHAESAFVSAWSDGRYRSRHEVGTHTGCERSPHERR